VQSIYLLADAVARAADVEEVYDRALDSIQLCLNVDRVSLLLFDADGVMRFKAWRGLSDKYRGAVEGHSPWTRGEKDPRPVLVRDVSTASGYEEMGPIILGEGIRSLAFIPLLHQGRLLGKFMLYYDTPNLFPEEDIQLAQTIAGHIAFAIDHKAAEDALEEAEKRYRGIFENAVFGAFQTTPSGHFITANDALARILGYESSQELVESVTNIANQIHVNPDRRAEFARILEEKGFVHSFEAQAYRKDRSVIWISLSARALRDQKGQLAGYEGIVEDVSARKKTEIELRENRARLDATYNEAAVGISEVDLRGGFLAVNDRFCEITGYSREELLNRRFQDITHPEDLKQDSELFARLKAGEIDRYKLEKRYIHANGSPIWIELSVTLVRDEAGRPNYRIGVVQDITARKRAEEGAEAAQRRLAFLAEASAILSSSLDYQTTLENVARLAVSGLGDLCSIDMVEDGLVRRVALAHVNPKKQKLFEAMDPVYRPDPKSRHPVLRVTKRRRPELVNGLSDDTLKEAARDEAHLKALRALGVHSAMVVPLVAGPRTLGAVTIVSAESSRVYDQADLALAEELARRAALAIENARLFQETENARQAAEQSANRTARLQSVTAALSEALTPSEVGLRVIDAAMAEMAGRSGIVIMFAPDEHLQIVATKGESKEFRKSWEAFAENPPEPILSAIRQGVPFFAETSRELLSEFPALSALDVPADRSFACVPLTIEGRATGAMVVSFDQRTFSGEEREFIQALAGQCAQALERARLYEAEVQSRAAAEEARQRVDFLAATSPVFLSGSVDYQGTLRRLAELIVPRFADWCSIDLLDAEGQLQRVIVLHHDPKKTELATRLQERYPAQVQTESGPRNVVRTGQPEIYPTIADEMLRAAAQDADHLKTLRGLGLKSAICAPLKARGKTLGAISFVTAEESDRQYSEDDLDFVEELCNRAALAIDNAALYDAEQKARAAAEAAQQRLWFLAESNAVLSSSLDFETTLARVAGLAVPWLADCCVAHVFPQDGIDARTSVCHADPAKEDLVRQLHTHYVPSPDQPHPLMEMIQTQAPVLLENIDASEPATIVQDRRHAEILRKLDFKSYMAVPLIARGRLFGALTFARSDVDRRYTQQDLSLAEELARRAALAIDNARLYENAQRVQEALRVALEAKDEFLGVMSHELRTPITAVYGGVRVLRSRAERLDEESKSRLLEDIEQESERLFRMVENLLVLSRLELGQEVATEPVMAQRTIGKLVSSYAQRRPSRKVALNVDEEMDPIAAEPHYLEQILRNLISNADKYSPADSPVEIAIVRREDEADISILDRGSGISPEESETIFERFYRSDRTASKAAGIGLGLTVCKRLTEAMGGRIGATPRPGGGLEVRVTLPIYKEAEP
jgi:PAS domain S-box-containing protein